MEVIIGLKMAKNGKKIGAKNWSFWRILEFWRVFGVVWGVFGEVWSGLKYFGEDC